MKKQIYVSMLLFIALSTGCAIDDKKDSFYVDMASLGSSFHLFLPPGEVPPNGNYNGTIITGRGYIYSEGTLPAECAPFDSCGVDTTGASPAPEFPTKVIGTYTLEAAITTPLFNAALNQLFAGNTDGYIQESLAIEGQEIFDINIRFKFNGSADFGLKGDDTIQITGSFPWGVKGQKWKMAILGGTGRFQKASGEVNFERLIVSNADVPGESFRAKFSIAQPTR